MSRFKFVGDEEVGEIQGAAHPCNRRVPLHFGIREFIVAGDCACYIKDEYWHCKKLCKIHLDGDDDFHRHKIRADGTQSQVIAKHTMH